MHELAGRRVKAYLCDGISYAGIAASMVPLGLLAYAAGWGKHRGFVMAASAVPPVLATLLAARQEARCGSTWGKCRYGLRVVDAHGEALGRGSALLRNTVKIAIPWQIGHTLAVGAAFGGFDDRDPLTISAAVITYPMIGVMTAYVVAGRGRALHDRVAGSQVLSAS